MPRTTKVKEEKIVTQDEPQTVAAVKAAPPWPLITIGVFATVVLVALLFGGWLFLVSHVQAPAQTMGRFGTLQQQAGGNYFGGGSGGYRRGGFGGGGNAQSAAFRGVVTAVNGDTLTVAGEGKLTTVQKSDGTTISGDKTDVAVNDTVVIYGTTNSDGSISATQILVRDQTGGSSLNDGSATPGA